MSQISPSLASSSSSLAVGVLSAIATTALMMPARAILRRAGVLDRPNARSSHDVPTVRGGGVAIVAVLAVVMAWFAACGSYSLPVVQDSAVELCVLLFAFMVLAVVSFIDDLKGLPARLRFLVQLGCAVTAVLVLIFNHGQPIGINTATAVLASVSILWVAGYTNAFNFMDGINGIAGTQAFVTAVGTGVIAGRLDIVSQAVPTLLCSAVAGASLGFLPHNFPRARVFMGDVSSAPLGFLLATLSFWIAALTSWWVLFWVALLHANFVLDTGITLVRRARRGDRLSQAHREHFYQRLVRAGYSHTFVTLAEAALQCVVVLAVGAATKASPAAKIAIAVAVVVMWLAFFAFAERKFKMASVMRPQGPIVR